MGASGRRRARCGVGPATGGGVGMAVRPDVPGTGHTGARALSRPETGMPVDAVPVGEAPAGAAPVDEVRVGAVPLGAVPVGAVPAEDAGEAVAEENVSGSTIPEPQAAPSVIPRWLLLVVGLAAATIAVAGLRAVAWLVAPVFLALVVVVALAPVQDWLRRVGVPRWLATTVLLLLVLAVLLSFVTLLVVSAAQFAALLPDYAGRAEILINGVVADLNDAGIVSGQLSDLVNQIDYGQFVGVATDVLGRFTSAASTLVLLLSALVFMAIESSGFSRRLALVGEERPHLPVAMTLFAQGTRSYLLVSTVFGAIVAVGDWITLAIIGVPAAALWGLLAFVTNYVPNIGFVLGVVPPALLGLLAGGWG